MIKTTTALKKNTTYRFGGICNDFYTLNEKSEIDKIHNLNFDNEYFILGKGSNVVFSDNNSIKKLESILSIRMDLV